MTPSDKDIEWELEEGIPQFEDPFIQKYLNGREALIEQEHKKRHDATFYKSMSTVAQEACHIVSVIRNKELSQVWTKGEDWPDDELLYPGVMFTVARKRMEQTKLWKIVERMPKGSLLHAHLDAMFDLDFLIDQAFETPGIHMSAPAPLLTKQDFEIAPFSFQYSSTPSDDKESIWAKEYQASSLINIQGAAATFPNGGEDGFRKWLKGRMMLSAEHSYYHHHGVNAIWEIFQRTFPIIGSILFYEPIFRSCLRRMLGELARDGIRYVDFRTAFVFEYRQQGVDTPEKDYIEFFRVFKDEIEKFKATEEGSRFYGARMIWTTLRFFPNKEIIENMKQCIIAKQAYPDMICGFDVVGQEDKGRPLADLIPVLFWFRKVCAEEAVEIPFFFHAGECLGDGDETDENLYDAILLGTRRIGHGYSLFKHPLLIDLVKEKKILIECCPISNEILRLSSTIKHHSLPALLSRGVSVSLNNDDPAVLGTGKNGLTHDFWQVLQGLENMGLSGLATMAENSVRWSCFEDQKATEWQADIRSGIMGSGMKAKRLQEWYEDFEKFCQWVVLEFADEVED
ncbi:putative CECR1 family adenosine deaminase [Talaromyces proteolyticus]|uniref:adenosine deaminase n=1 Tax=Talaromyces proteolyticus TaxID=1131652 RepID=A0AAD4Q0W9_9EURO|nr:putative CECR1 family adenosine deaminase [Talaromyces proteolyticus]KAH8701644.1 putative CECR1 family adenosine deaminase [Talaromyces proteolyticus]